MAGIEETLAKVEQLLPSHLRHRVDALHTYASPATGAGPTVNAEVLQAITPACRDCQCLRFDYEDNDGVATVRTVEPHRMMSRGHRWYLVAWDVHRENWRTFRVDRTNPRIPTGPRFTPRALPGGDAADYVTRGVDSAIRKVHARIRLNAPQTEIARNRPPGCGAIERVDQHTCLLETSANSVETLASFISPLGVDFEVVEPPELIEYVRLLAERYRQAI